MVSPNNHQKIHTVLSPKKPTRIHINRASKSEVEEWQHWMKRLIPRLEQLGFMIFVQDESIFILDAIVGRMYWTKTTTIPYTGNHSKAVVYGAFSSDGSQMFQIIDSMTGEAFVQFLKDLYKRFGKIAVMVDGSKTHSSKIVKEYLKG